MSAKNTPHVLAIFGAEIFQMDFVEELTWRGMVHDIMPGTQEALNKEMCTAYVGFDPTADSLHVGSLVPIMLLKHFQRCGHKPIALVGGATGMVGDPSGKSEERNLLDKETLDHNVECIKEQIGRFLEFGEEGNQAEMANNYDWFGEMNFLDFIRDVGKHITVNYMMAKDSVKSRLETGLSFTEFSYQLVQGYDFYYLHKNRNCTLQLGGSDQWGNIVTGTELIRRMGGGEAYAITCPLIKKADGGKFGKTESGNIWLSRERTSPYKFYQFWLNASDDDAGKYIRIFTEMEREKIESLEKEHAEAPHMRLLQKALAEDITVRVHSQEDLNAAIEASNILFGKATSETLGRLSEQDFLDVFEGVPHATASKAAIEGASAIDVLSDISGFLNSKGEARRALKENSISINKEKVGEDHVVQANDLINGKYLLLQRGKKSYFLLTVE